MFAIGTIFQRYILKSILFTTVFASGVLSFILVLGNVFRHMIDLILNQNVPVLMVLQFMVYVVPFLIPFTVPWGFLTAVLLVFGRMSADHEITALNAQGISLRKFCMPVIALAVVLSGLSLWMYGTVAPQARLKMKNLPYEIAAANPMDLFKTQQVTNDFPGIRMYIGSKSGTVLTNFQVFELDVVTGDVVSVAVAKRAEVVPAVGDQPLKVKLMDALVEVPDANAPRNAWRVMQGIQLEEAELDIPLHAIGRHVRKAKTPSTSTIAELRALLRVNPDDVWARVELHKRFSFSLGPVVLLFVGLALAVSTKRKETSVGMGLSVVIAFSYYLGFTLLDMVKQNAAWHPELLIWLPNVIFLTLGLVMSRRLLR